MRPNTGHGHHNSWGFYITHNDPPQSVGLLWTSDQLVAETSSWQHTTDKHRCPGGIRTHDLSRRAAADVRLRPRGHWDRHIYRVPRRNAPDFGRVFLMLKYTDITQNTYIQSWTITEIMAREKWVLPAVPNTATCTADVSRDSANVLETGMQCSLRLHDG